MADVYPNVYVGFALQENQNPDGSGGTVADADFINTLSATLFKLEQVVGLAGDAAGVPTHEGRIKYTEALGLPRFTRATSAPTSPPPNVGDVFIDTTSTPWQWKQYDSSAWVLIGANAVQVQGVPVDGTTPTNGQVLTYNSGLSTAKWMNPAASVGFANPMVAIGDVIVGGTSGAAGRLAAGAPGQILSVSTSNTPAWVTPTYIPSPVGLQQGDVFYYNGTAVVRLGVGASGQFLQTNGPSANPAWANLPASPPGSAITAPTGSFWGDVLFFNGTNWVQLHPGPSGYFLKTNGINADPEWAVPSGGSGMTNPMTTLGDIIIAQAGGTADRLPPGATGKVLTMSATVPTWQDAVGFANPMTTQYDLILAGAAGAPTRLAKGTDTQVLKVVSGAVQWAADVGFANPMSSISDLIIGGSGGTPVRLAAGTAGQLLGMLDSVTVGYGSLTTFGALSNPLVLTNDLVMGGTTTNLSNPSVAPTIAVTGGGSTGGGLQAGTYYAKYTWVNAQGQTLASPESAQFTVAAGNIPRVTLAGLPGGATSATLYLTAAGGSVNTETRYATGIATTTYDVTAATVGGNPAPPSTNTAALTAAPARLAMGGLGQVLTVVIGGGGQPALGWAAAPGSTGGLTNPMTTTNDLILGGASGAPVRLPKGTDSQVLTVDPVSHSVMWMSVTGLTNPMTTTDDTIVSGAGGTPTRLPKGADSQVLTVDPSDHHVKWMTASGGFGDPMTTIGDIIVRNASNVTARLGIGSTGQFIGITSGVPAWKTIPTFGVGQDGIVTGPGSIIAGQFLASNGAWATPSGGGFSNPMTALGDLIKGGAAGAAARLAIGSTGDVLTVSGGAPVWAAPSGGGGTSLLSFMPTLVPPVLTSLTKVNENVATPYTQDGSTVLMHTGQLEAFPNVRMLGDTVTHTHWHFRALVLPSIAVSLMGIYVADSAGKFVFMRLTANNNTGWQSFLNNFNSPTSHNSGIAGAIGASIGSYVWLHAWWDGTSIFLSYSTDGTSYPSLYVTTPGALGWTAGHIPTQYGLGMEGLSSLYTPTIRILSWEEFALP